eukprot:gene25148-10779_t
MPPCEPPEGSGVSLEFLPVDILKSHVWPRLSSNYKRMFRLLNKNMRDLGDACITKQHIRIPAGPSYKLSLQKQLTTFSQVETLTLECLDTYETSGEGSTEDATVHDVVHLFRACSLSLRLTLVTLVLHECCLDGPAFLALADCHSLTTLKLHCPKITSIEATESITCLTQLRSLEIIMDILDVDVPLLPLLLMPGLTNLEVLGDLDSDGDLCWGSPMMSLEDMRPSALRRLNLCSDQEVQPPFDRAAVLRLLPQLQDLTLDYCALPDSDAEALAGLSALTRLEFAGRMELTRPHLLPILKHLCLSDQEHVLFPWCSAGVSLRQLDWLIGGSTNLREIWHKTKHTEFPDSMGLYIYDIRNNLHDLATALRSVSLALQQCRMKVLRLDHGVGDRLRLQPEMIEALAPLNETLKVLHLFRFIVDEDVIRSIAGQLTHVRAFEEDEEEEDDSEVDGTEEDADEEDEEEQDGED